MNENIIIYTETTGLDPDDEVLELTILKENGDLIMSERFRPVNKLMWPEAEAVNNISPEDVRNMPMMPEKAKHIENIINNAWGIIGHNTYFHINMLKQSGINITNNNVLDICTLYSRIKHHNYSKPMWAYRTRYALREMIDSYRIPPKNFRYSSLNKAHAVRELYICTANFIRNKLAQIQAKQAQKS